MRTRSPWLIVLLFGVVAAACPKAPQVVQGTVVSYDASSTVLVITDETDPGREVTLVLEGAEVGAPPAPGDVVRVAYFERNGKLAATRVMNLTRQSEVRGGGGH